MTPRSREAFERAVLTETIDARVAWEGDYPIIYHGRDSVGVGADFAWAMWQAATARAEGVVRAARAVRDHDALQPCYCVDEETGGCTTCGLLKALAAYDGEGER